jgi:hypothetical protein
MNTYFFIFLGIAIIGIIGAIINFISALKGRTSFGALFIRHAICAIFWVTGLIGSMVTGIMWTLKYLKS